MRDASLDCATLIIISEIVAATHVLYTCLYACCSIKKNKEDFSHQLCPDVHVFSNSISDLMHVNSCGAFGQLELKSRPQLFFFCYFSIICYICTGNLLI